jgi:RND family efflux transporter MFP subunit
MTEVVASDPEVRRLKDVLEYCAISDAETHVVATGDEVVADREETRVKFLEYFRETGSRAWYAVPLADDQGRLGILSFESRNPDFLSENHLELVRVLASQATVALRNASLYTEVPLIGVLEPLIQKKQQFMRMEKHRRAALIAATSAALMFLAFFPLPMRVIGDATVSPHTMAQVQAEVSGVVQKVYVREGDPVEQGTILADLEAWDYRSALAAAQAKYSTALAEMNRALANNDGSQAGIQKVQADYWASEVVRASERLEHTHLRSPIEGVVTTPHIETSVARTLAVGDTFAQVIDSSRATVDVAVDETDLPLLRAGENAAVKLDSFPTRKFRGTVAIVSPSSVPEGDNRVFYARVQVPNPGGLIRPGMKGLSKISTGWRPAGYVFFRNIAMWFWSKLWSWFGW